MKIIEIKVYQIDELSDEAKQIAIEELANINVDYDWWNFTYEDAKNIGLKITEFDLERNRHCDGKFFDEPKDVAKKIIEQHGESCGTYKTATNYLAEISLITTKYGTITIDEEIQELYEQEMFDAVEEFLQDLLEDYLILLQNEYEYLTSEEAIIETIKANEYEFLETGKKY